MREAVSTRRGLPSACSTCKSTVMKRNCQKISLIVLVGASVLAYLASNAQAANIVGAQVEHMWLSDVRLLGNRFQGQVDNSPRKTQGLKLGRLITLKPSEISAR